MTESKTTRLFNLFFHSDLQFTAEWSDSGIAAIVVAHRYRYARDLPKPGTEQLPQPSEEQLEAIKNVLGAAELETEEVSGHTDEVDGLVIYPRTVKFTAKK